MFKKILTSILAVVMSVGLVVTETACSSSQVAQAVSTIESQLPVVLNDTAVIAKLSGNTPVYTILSTAATLVTNDTPTINAAIAAWKANKTSGNFDALTAVVTSLASNVNTQLLAANKVVNTQSELLAVASLSTLSLVLNAMSIALTNAGGKTAAMSVPTNVVSQFYQKTDVENMAHVYGITYNQAVKLLA